MKSIGRSVASAIKGRSFAGQAAAKQAEHKFAVTPQDVRITKLPSGVVVASLENYSPVSRVAVVYGAGSRHESPDGLGITHAIRAATNLGTKNATGFAIAKNIQQIGGSLECSTTREHVVYTVNCLRNHLAAGIEQLNNVATGHVFKPWEVQDSVGALKLDLDLYHSSPEVQLIELLHKAAFRDTLGQSLYIEPDRIGSFHPAALDAFVKSHYVAHNASVAGVGVDHDVLVRFARKMTFTPGNAPEHKKAKYHGGELRLHQRSPLVHAAIVTEGVAMSSPELFPVSLLQLILGSGPYVKYSTNLASSKVAKAAASATSKPFAASAITASYLDSGLFGFQVAVDAKDARKVLKAILGTMGQATKSTITEAEVQRAKNQLKASVHFDAESGAERLNWCGTEALSGQVFGLEQFNAEVEKVTLDDVNKVAKKLLNGKLTMAAVGDLADTPYLDELL